LAKKGYNIIFERKAYKIEYILKSIELDGRKKML